VTLKTGSAARQGHMRSHRSIEPMRLPTDVLELPWRYLVPFMGYPMSKNVWPWNRCQRSLKVIESDSIRSIVHMISY